MNIALIGYGKMGKAVEALAPSRGHHIVTAVDNPHQWSAHLDAIRTCDVAVDFSQPDVAVDNIEKCFDLHLPVVVGTTGWYDQLDRVVHLCRQQGQALFVASNFSIGMNIMFDLNRRLAHLMNRRPDYDVSISETHHVHKLDAPSGTAISLANDVIGLLDRKTSWLLVDAQASSLDSSAIPVFASRQGEVPGIHEVVYDSPIDTLSIRHSAKNRQGLALGALMAAEYLSGRKGYYTMRDLLADDE